MRWDMFAQAAIAQGRRLCLCSLTEKYVWYLLANKHQILMSYI